MLLKNKMMLLSLLFGLSALPVMSAEVLYDVEFPKSPAYRVGISELPEKQYVQALQEKVKSDNKVDKLGDTEDVNFADLTYADLTIKRLSKEIAQELEYEEQDMLADLSLLWQGAAMQSDTINFALYKLANPDADKPDEKSVRNVLKTIASMSTLVGASMGSPLIAGSSLIGGNIFGIMSQDTKALNYKYTRVNDADMIILIRKVEDLQQKAVDLYYDYMSAKKQLEFANDLVEDRQRKFELAQKNNAARELVVITDAYYRTALDKQRTAKSEFFSKRAALEQFVGRETFLQFEAELAARERGETTKTLPEQKTEDEIKVQEIEYNKTVEDVKTFTEGVVPKNVEEIQVADPEVKEVEEDSVEQKSDVKKLKFWEKKDKTDKNKENKVDVKQEVLPIELPTTEEYQNAVYELENENNSTYDYSDSSPRLKYFDDPMYEGVTGLAANTEEPVKKSFLQRFKKDKASNDVKPVKEKKEKVKKEKVDPKSTKNLIFLHGEDKQTAKNRLNFNVNGKEIEPSFIDEKPNKKKENVEQQNKSEFEFLPLDEIRTPDLTREGYSIHSEYMY
ncbi:hypothetical protein IKL64_04770 [bacterium]|nr:hypothetical protein [bacterium]